MKDPNIFFLNNVLDSAKTNAAQIGGVWVPARPLGFSGLRYRFKAAWLVWTGRADALIWPANQ